MSDRKKEIQVGAAFLLALTILVAGVLWFKEFSLGDQYNHLLVKFENTSGLKDGDAVEVRGVPSGTVKDIDYEEEHALVTLRIERGVALYQNTRVTIGSVGIMGQKMVAIFPGDSSLPPLDFEIPLTGEYQAGVPELMDGVSRTMETFERLAIRLETLLKSFDETEQGTLTRILENLDSIAEDMARVMNNSEGSLSRSVENFSKAMGSIHAALDGHEEQVGQALESANESMERLNQTLIRADSSLASLNSILTTLERGEGSVGMALQDSTLYIDLRNTIRETQSLIADIKADPRRYFKFSVF